MSRSLLCPDFRDLFKAASLSFICCQRVSFNHGKVVFCPCLHFTFLVKAALISVIVEKKVLQLISVSLLVRSSDQSIWFIAFSKLIVSFLGIFSWN